MYGHVPRCRWGVPNPNLPQFTLAHATKRLAHRLPRGIVGGAISNHERTAIRFREIFFYLLTGPVGIRAGKKDTGSAELRWSKTDAA